MQRAGPIWNPPQRYTGLTRHHVRRPDDEQPRGAGDAAHPGDHDADAALSAGEAARIHRPVPRRDLRRREPARPLLPHAPAHAPQPGAVPRRAREGVLGAVRAARHALRARRGRVAPRARAQRRPAPKVRGRDPRRRRRRLRRGQARGVRALRRLRPRRDHDPVPRPRGPRALARARAWAGNKNIQHDFNVHGFARFRHTLFGKNSPRENDLSENQPKRLRCDRAREV